MPSPVAVGDVRGRCIVFRCRQPPQAGGIPVCPEHRIVSFGEDGTVNLDGCDAGNGVQAMAQPFTRSEGRMGGTDQTGRTGGVSETHTYQYAQWNVIREIGTSAGGQASRRCYVWGALRFWALRSLSPYPSVEVARWLAVGPEQLAAGCGRRYPAARGDPGRRMVIRIIRI